MKFENSNFHWQKPENNKLKKFFLCNLPVFLGTPERPSFGAERFDSNEIFDGFLESLDDIRNSDPDEYLQLAGKITVWDESMVEENEQIKEYFNLKASGKEEEITKLKLELAQEKASFQDFGFTQAELNIINKLLDSNTDVKFNLSNKTNLISSFLLNIYEKVNLVLPDLIKNENIEKTKKELIAIKEKLDRLLSKARENVSKQKELERLQREYQAAVLAAKNVLGAVILKQIEVEKLKEQVSTASGTEKSGLEERLKKEKRKLSKLREWEVRMLVNKAIYEYYASLPAGEKARKIDSGSFIAIVYPSAKETNADVAERYKRRMMQCDMRLFDGLCEDRVSEDNNFALVNARLSQQEIDLRTLRRKYRANPNKALAQEIIKKEDEFYGRLEAYHSNPIFDLVDISTLETQIQEKEEELSPKEAQLKAKGQEMAKAKDAYNKEKNKTSPDATQLDKLRKEYLKSVLEYELDKREVDQLKEEIDGLKENLKWQKTFQGRSPESKPLDKGGSYWNIFEKALERKELRKRFDDIERKLWLDSGIPEPADPKVKEFLLFACFYGYVELGNMITSLNTNSNLLYSQVAKGLSSSEPTSSGLAGLSEALAKFKKIETKKLTERLRNLQLEAFEKKTGVDLRATREKFIRLYFGQEGNGQANIIDPHLWFDEKGKFNEEEVNSSMLEKFLVMHNDVMQRKINPEAKNTSQASGALIENTELLKLLQGELLSRMDNYQKTLSDYYNAEQSGLDPDFMERGFDTWMDMVTSGDPLKMTTAVGILYGIYKVAFGGGKLGEYGKYIFGGVLLREFIKEYNGYDIFEEIGLFSEEKGQEGAIFQIYLDKLDWKKEELNPTAWQQKALESKQSPRLMKAMNDIEMHKLLDWHKKTRASEIQVDNAGEVIMNGMPDELKIFIEDLPGSTTESKQADLAMISLGLLELYFKDLSMERSKYKKPSVEEGIKVAEKMMSNSNLFNRKAKEKVTFGNLLALAIDKQDFNRSLEKNRDITDFVTQKFGEAWATAVPYLKDVARSGKEKLPVVIALLKKFFKEDAIPFVKDMANKGWNIVDTGIEKGKEYIEIAQGSKTYRLLMGTPGTDGLILKTAKLPFETAGWALEFSAEKLPEALTLLRHFSFNVVGGYVNMLSSMKNPEKEVTISSADALKQAVKDAGIHKQVQEAYGFVRPGDLDLALEYLFDPTTANSSTAKSFNTLITEIRKAVGEDTDLAKDSITQGEICRLFLVNLLGVDKLLDYGADKLTAGERKGVDLFQRLNSFAGDTGSLIPFVGDNVDKFFKDGNTLLEGAKLNDFNIKKGSRLPEVIISFDQIQKSLEKNGNKKIPWTVEMVDKLGDEVFKKAHANLVQGKSFKSVDPKKGQILMQDNSEKFKVIFKNLILQNPSQGVGGQYTKSGMKNWLEFVLANILSR